MGELRKINQEKLLGMLQGWSTGDVEGYIGISMGTFSYIKRGLRDFNYNHLHKICNYFSEDINDYLID